MKTQLNRKCCYNSNKNIKLKIMIKKDDKEPLA